MTASLGAALVAPPFDPRKQSRVAALLAAVEALASAPFLLLPLGALLARGNHRVTTIHGVTNLCVGSLLGALLLWAGLSLMYGWRSRRKAQALLWAVLVTLTMVVAVLKRM